MVRLYNFYKNNLYLWYALGVLLIAYAIHFFASLYNYLGDNKEVSFGIKERVFYQLKLVDKDLDLISRNLQQADYVNFTSSTIESEFPFYVFSDSKLLLWSNNKFIPEYEELSGNYRHKYFSIKQGKFLVKKELVTTDKTTFEVFVLLPLFLKYPIQNEYLVSGFNPRIFDNNQIQVTSYLSEYNENNIYLQDGEYLFTIVLPETFGVSDDIAWLVLMISLVGLMLIGVYTYQKGKRLLNKYGRIYTSIFWIGSVILLRIGLLLIRYPTIIKSLKLFNAKYFAYSIFVPSLGDMVLHVISLTTIFGIIFYNHKWLHLSSIINKLKIRYQWMISILIIVICHLCLLGVFEVIKILYINSQWELDITKSLKFDLFKILCLLIFALVSMVFFWVNQMCLKHYIKIHRKTSDLINVILILGTSGVYSIFSYYFNDFYWPLWVCSAVQILILVKFKLTATLAKFEYKTYVYFLVSAIVCSIAAAYSIYQVNLIKDLTSKGLFSSKLLTDNDLYGEFLMKESSESIKNDALIRSRFYGILSSKELVEQKVRKYYLSKYFDKYDINIKLFDENGQEKVINNGEIYHNIKRKYSNRKYKTDYRNLLLVNELSKNKPKKYINFIEIDKQGIIVGYIIVEFQLKRIIPNSVYPSLLVDKKFTKSVDKNDFSYAIFENDTLNYSYGSYNYVQNFIKTVNKMSISQDNEFDFDYNNYKHLVIKAFNKRTIIISSPKYQFYDAFSNFSFWFLTLIFSIMMLVLAYSLYVRMVSIKLNFVTKIQIYLNLAFFFPLFVVSIATLGLMANIYRNDLKVQFSTLAEKSSEGISDYFEAYKSKRISKDALSNAFFELAKYSESDINLYDRRGRLLISSQSKIYDLALLSQFINPNAYSAIIELKKKNIIIDEMIGKLKYYAVYVAVKSPRTGELLGVLSVPFFETESELETKLISVFTTIINIFTIVFILFLLLSFYATRFLTYPLLLLRQRLQGISLDYENEPLIWNSFDEIGMLVNEYNKMLLKLNESKQQLAKSEKESAWKEMAKQVAHEIKNPLTPMKLSLQYLQMQLKNKNENVDKLTDKTIVSVLEQINNLSDIATSFSSFAKMPDPKLEKYDLLEVTKRTIGLYNNSKDVQIKLEADEFQKYVIRGDAQLMGRIINNLILNALQSVPDSRIPLVQIYLNKTDTTLSLIVADNGIGIPEEIQSKVFLPNFSTKYYGSGIGLAVAKNGIEHAGGKIWFETIKGEGTKFIIEFNLP